MQAQELDIEGNKTEAEKKAAQARKLNIASYISSAAYFIVVSAVFSAIVIAVRR